MLLDTGFQGRTCRPKPIANSAGHSVTITIDKSANDLIENQLFVSHRTVSVTASDFTPGTTTITHKISSHVTHDQPLFYVWGQAGLSLSGLFLKRMNEYSELITSESTVVLQSCILEGFDAPTDLTSDVSGLLVYIKNSGALTATDTIFRNANSAEHAGVKMDGGKIKLTRCSFTGLRSSLIGAALVFMCISPTDTIIDSCTFDGNIGRLGVVGIDFVQYGLTMKDCLFINSDRHGDILCAYEIYIVGTPSLPSNYKTMITSSYSTSPSGEREELYYGKVSSSDEALLSVTLTTITVSADGTDSSTCGLTPVLTCRTTSHALSRLPGCRKLHPQPNRANNIRESAVNKIRGWPRSNMCKTEKHTPPRLNRRTMLA
ncbi:hypothetical protein BLNAU_11830 [Blattamonas nauphoetae]|uniref:Right handed beta helix domain-containing protein n=1 Tax=Blattamonas nauphoetae TaxID=2049346 RepID=A0ABQ9XPT3_9EUKA|nr:hypothetical protein BLNAU_11830 [Blattamonas nauphoetae]